MTAVAAKPRPTNLPAELTSFVGRRRELADVKQHLTTTRLLTLTGAGGIGKTRLAMRAAAEMLRAYPDGIWLVDLAPLQDPTLVTQAVFGSLGLQEQAETGSMATLAGYLAPRSLLLVLDNCEHLLDACAVLTGALLRACPRLRVLATSRQPLGVAGELRFPVAPLTLPRAEEAGSPERALSSDSVSLFEERAAAVLPGFRIDPGNAVAVAELCRRLEGIPLALELAAVRLASLGVEELAEGLAAGLDALGRGDRSGPARQRTLGATIDWSFNLLTEAERALWSRLSVFSGSFPLDAVRRVCDGAPLADASIADVLGDLVDKSIVTREAAAGRARFRLLETMRHYGQDRLAERGEESAVRQRHALWIADLGRAAARADAAQTEAFDRVQLELANLWSALDHMGRDPAGTDAALELMYDLTIYWIVRGPLADARRVVAALVRGAGGETVARAKGFAVSGELARAHHDRDTALTLLIRSLELGRRLGSREVVRWALFRLAVVLWIQGEGDAAGPMVEEARGLADADGDTTLTLAILTMLTEQHLRRSDLTAGLASGLEAIAVSESLGEVYYRSFAMRAVAGAHLQRGELDEAEALGRQAVALKHELGAGEGLAIAVETLGWIAAERGAAERAAVLLGAAAGVYRSIPGSLLPMYRRDHERGEARARERLGDRTFDAAFERGAAMTKDEAVGYALERSPASGRRGAARQASPLTRRELEVARLVATGAGNREIGGRLFISERTVETHVTNMLNKLGLSSRLQLGHWVADLPST